MLPDLTYHTRCKENKNESGHDANDVATDAGSDRGPGRDCDIGFCFTAANKIGIETINAVLPGDCEEMGR